MTTSNLKSRRLAVGLSQQALAQYAGCSLASVRVYEGGLVPRYDAAVYDRIVKALAAAERNLNHAA